MDDFHADRLLRNWIRQESFISIPDYIPSGWRETGYNVPWIERAAPPNFWEQIQYRDPSPDHLHAVIPGHRYDALVAALTVIYRFTSRGKS